MRILVCRPDRLGDVVLSTPVLEAIRRFDPESQVTFLVQSSLVPILKGLPSIHRILSFQPQGRHAGIQGFLRLVSEIRRERFDAAVILQSHWKIGLAVFLAGVPKRVGPWSKIHSYLFYNLGIRQRRSQVEMHESDYNLQLLQKLGIRTESRQVLTQIHLELSVIERAGHWLKDRGWSEKFPLIQIHPGMGGSALNWPEPHYLDLMRSLLKEGKQILVTGGPLEKDLLSRYELFLGQTIGQIQGKAIFYQANAGDSLDFLGALSSHCQLVVAPSTGPLHLAVALRKPVVTFYPPIRVQSSFRWGPYVAQSDQAIVLIPQVHCGQDRECIGSLCQDYPCMEKITVKQVLKEVHQQLAHSTQERTSD